jgi:hypothetical protein
VVTIFVNFIFCDVIEIDIGAAINYEHFCWSRQKGLQDFKTKTKN